MAAKIEKLEARAYTIPTEEPESDGTLQWDATTIVVVTASAEGQTGTGYSYTDASSALLIDRKLRQVVEGGDALAPQRHWDALVASLRNVGRPGLASAAVSAIDAALWDLKARLLALPLVTLLGQLRPSVPIYGSGGFTSYSVERLQEQLAGWVKQGITRVKMKVGRQRKNDLERVAAARDAIGDADLFVDGNGAYTRKDALGIATAFARFGVSWFEEPVSSDDLEGLRLLRDRAPGGMAIAAGEYGYDSFYFRRMLEAGAVDVLRADATRCGGVTGFLSAAQLCHAHNTDLSAHTAPMLHAHVACAVPRLAHVEHFYDHVRIENMLFDGVLQPVDGTLRPDLSATGTGLALNHEAARRFQVYPEAG